ncbi:MAG: Gfo/Idh/MocA family oxidoreductase [Balneolales bacterium]
MGHLSDINSGFKSTESTKNIPEIGIGMLGYSFMGKAHTNAFRTIPFILSPPPAIPKLVAICGRDKMKVADAADKFGYQGYYTDWRKMIEDEKIQLFDNGGPNNLHAESSIEALKAGKHVLCEKPMARTAEEGWRMLDVARKYQAKHMVAFNYRFVPAIRFLRSLIENGTFGKLYHFRASYLQDWLIPRYETPRIWRLEKEKAGSGAMGDLGSHIIDLAHFLLGNVQSVNGMTQTFIDERPLPGNGELAKVDVDDAFISAVEFENGAMGILEGSRYATGRKNYQVIEINGEKGSARFNLERLNELQVCLHEDSSAQEGFKTILMTEAEHPWMDQWWPPGHIIGWEHTFVHEISHFLNCIAYNKEVGPYGATFEDGYRACVVSDAILQSARQGKVVDCEY